LDAEASRVAPLTRPLFSDALFIVQQWPVINTHGFVVAADFFKLGCQGLQATLADAQLIERHLQLALYLVVMSLQFLY
jgi:hypothetical protein